MDLGERLRAAREAAGLSQQELADHVGVSLRSIGHWETGNRSPRNKIHALERVLRVTLRDTPDHDDRTPRLTTASDAHVLAEMAHRLAERDDRIRSLMDKVDGMLDTIGALQAELAEARARLATPPGLTMAVPKHLLKPPIARNAVPNDAVPNDTAGQAAEQTNGDT